VKVDKQIVKTLSPSAAAAPSF